MIFKKKNSTHYQDDTESDILLILSLWEEETVLYPDHYYCADI